MNVDVIGKLSEFAPRMRIADLINDVFFTIGWFIIQIMMFLATTLEYVWVEMLKLLGFFSSDAFRNFVKDYQTPAIAIGVFCGLLFIYRYIKDPNTRLQSMLDTILLGICVIFILPTGLGKVTDMVKDYNASENSKINTVTYQTLNSYVYDLDVFNKLDWASPKTSLYDFAESKKDPNGELSLPLNDKTIQLVDIKERYEDSRSGISKTSSEILKKKPTLDELGNPKAIDKSNGFFGMGREQYYRYSIDFFPLIISLACLIWIYLSFAKKVVSAVLQMAFTSIITVALAFKDWADGATVKRGLKNIMGYLIQIIFIPISMQLYLAFSSFLADTFSDKSGAVYLVALLFSTFAFIEGPYFLQEITGIESHYKGLGNTLMAMANGSRVAKDMGKALGSLGKGAWGVARGTATRTGGFAAAGVGALNGAFGKEDDFKNINNDEKNADNSNDGYGQQSLDQELAQSKGSQDQVPSDSTFDYQNADKLDGNLDSQEQMLDQEVSTHQDTRENSSQGETVDDFNSDLNRANEPQTSLNDELPKEEHSQRKEVHQNMEQPTLQKQEQRDHSSNDTVLPDNFETLGSLFKEKTRDVSSKGIKLFSNTQLARDGKDRVKKGFKAGKRFGRATRHTGRNIKDKLSNNKDNSDQGDKA